MAAHDMIITNCVQQTFHANKKCCASDIYHVGVNTQVWTYTQIPAYVQLRTLFQPRVLLQPRAHLCHSQVPHPATIPIIPVLAEKLTIPASQVPFLRMVMRRPCSIFWPPVILMTGSQVYWKGHSPSTVPI